MATGKSGSFTVTASSFTLKISWSETYDVIANTSKVKLTATVKSSKYAVDYYPNGSISVNGTKIATFDSVTPTHMLYLATKNTYYGFTSTKGTAKNTWTTSAISHSSDGTKNVDIDIDIKLYTPSGSYGSGAHFDTTQTIALTSIDRVAPTVSFTTSNITTTGFKIAASTNVTCDLWYYSIDGGDSYTKFSSTSGTSASVTLSGLSVNTSYSVRIKARKKSNQVYGHSSKKTVKTLGQAAVHSASAFYADASTVTLKLSVTVYQASYTESVAFKNGSTTLFTVSDLSWSAGKATRSLELTDAQREAILSAMKTVKSKNFTIVVTTKNGSTTIGTTSATITAKTSSSNSAPTFTAFEYTDSSHSAVTGDASKLIQSYSKLVVTATAATAKNQASISYYTATISDVTVKSTTTTINVGTVASSGSMTLTVTAVDSRGYSKSINKTITVLKYSKIKISKSQARREDGIGTTIQLSFNGTMSTIKADGNTNTNGLETAKYRYKATDEDSYGSYVSLLDSVTIPSAGTSFSYETLQLMDLDASKSYHLQVYVADAVTGYRITITIPRGIPLLALRKDKVGVNNPTPQHTLDITGTLGINGNQVVDYVVESGTSGDWDYMYYASGRKEAVYNVIHESLAFSAVGNIYRSDGIVIPPPPTPASSYSFSSIEVNGYGVSYPVWFGQIIYGSTNYPDDIALRVFSPVSTSQNVRIRIHAIYR